MSDIKPMTTVALIIDHLGGVSAAAEKLSASRPAIYDWIAQGRFPGHRAPALVKAGIPAEDVMALVASRKQAVA